MVKETNENDYIEQQEEKISLFDVKRCKEYISCIKVYGVVKFLLMASYICIYFVMYFVVIFLKTWCDYMKEHDNRF